MSEEQDAKEFIKNTMNSVSQAMREAMKNVAEGKDGFIRLRKDATGITVVSLDPSKVTVGENADV